MTVSEGKKNTVSERKEKQHPKERKNGIQRVFEINKQRQYLQKRKKDRI